MFQKKGVSKTKDILLDSTEYKNLFYRSNFVVNVNGCFYF